MKEEAFIISPNPFYTKVEGDPVFFFRNVSTNNPTRKHILNEKTGNTYCGWDDDAFGQVLMGNYGPTMEFECCKHCLKAHKKQLNESKS